jgi:hypothetical protein
VAQFIDPPLGADDWDIGIDITRVHPLNKEKYTILSLF